MFPKIEEGHEMKKYTFSVIFFRKNIYVMYVKYVLEGKIPTTF